jgi:serine carboxypeptidase-like clade 4
MEIAPYCLNEAQQYNSGDPLSANPYGWSNITNLLFIDSPAGTGYSINKDPNFVHDDSTTSKDLFFAVKEFFNSKFP